MGLGAIITSGDGNEYLSDRLMDCLTEVRVEQTLDRPAKFAMRFQEDLDDSGEAMIMDSDELACERIITIAVKVGDELECLVRGPITETKCSVALGGPGSWFEVRGEDRRVEMGRVCHRRAWVGKASGAAETILSSYGVITDIQETTQEYAEDTNTLNQRATDLDFLNQIARQNNLTFWFTYEAKTDPLNPFSSSLDVEETVHFKSSPPRPDNAVSLPIPLPPLPLVSDVDVSLVVNPPPEKCQTVTSFELNVNVERPTSYQGQAVDDRSANVDDTTAEDPQPPVVEGGQSLRDLAPAERSFCVVTAGNQIEVQNRAQAALTQAGWMLNATASTTAHMLEGILIPHDVVEVTHIGKKHSGAYQVSQVAHTINGADHHMEIQLRRNSLGNPDGNGLPL